MQEKNLETLEKSNYMTDEALFQRSQKIIQENDGHPVCPWCLSQDTFAGELGPADGASAAGSRRQSPARGFTRMCVCRTCGGYWWEDYELSRIETVFSNRDELRKRLYRAYQLEWMLSHGHSVEELCCEVVDPESGFDDNGFGGELWVSFDEFVDTEYRDREYVRGLVDLMDLDEEREMLLARYEGDIAQMEFIEEEG